MEEEVKIDDVMKEPEIEEYPEETEEITEGEEIAKAPVTHGEEEAIEGTLEEE